MVEADLHLHTTHSDGRLTPTQLVELVAAKGLRAAAITDHDSTEGIPEALEAASRFPQLTIIPGVELSTDIPGNEIHMLGYFIRYEDEAFQQTLRSFRDGRVDRAREMVDKLAALGLPLDWERVCELAEGAVGRPHIAQAMVEKGYITYPQEAFTHYIGRNGPAYAERDKMTPAEAVQYILGVGGVPVLAHPHVVDNVELLLPELAEAGLAGIEVYYKEYTPKDVETFGAMADRYALIPCGGSDYHAFGTPGEEEPGVSGPPLVIVDRLRERAAELSASRQ
ncbi:MAG: PHP domain-containing protein [Chloroflexota bacterium]|nr:PHP domain-containing protein [Chloroflexota bacterium]MDE2941271.1 PHP domain-containing protein [Chloroflexota bacterium]MDE3267795.1 PHP domain-containing protein [Chloroflexota bacterium]